MRSRDGLRTPVKVPDGLGKYVPRTDYGVRSSTIKVGLFSNIESSFGGKAISLEEAEVVF